MHPVVMRDVLTDSEIDAIGAQIGYLFQFAYCPPIGPKGGGKRITGIVGVPGGAEIHDAEVEALIENQRWKRYRLGFAAFYRS
jgi:hypothetical protein